MFEKELTLSTMLVDSVSYILGVCSPGETVSAELTLGS